MIEPTGGAADAATILNLSNYHVISPTFVSGARRQDQLVDAVIRLGGAVAETAAGFARPGG